MLFAYGLRRLNLFERSVKRGGSGSQKLKGRRKKRGGSVEGNSEVVDQKDKRKPIVLLISEQKRPVEKWIREGFLLLPTEG
jgi:Zn-dependent oligopeptidase